MKKILIIEDDQTMRENTAEILELAQFKVFTAPNGKIGSMMAKEVKPDLIICDIMMPELDGYGVLHVLAKDPKTASIPFIFLTAKAEKSEIRKGMAKKKRVW
jgi:CheY-like chemotaxis protein